MWENRQTVIMITLFGVMLVLIGYGVFDLFNRVAGIIMMMSGVSLAIIGNTALSLHMKVRFNKLRKKK
jgi:hypothetical protein